MFFSSFYRGKDPWNPLRRIREFFEAQEAKFTVQLAGLFNIYPGCFYRRQPIAKSGFLGRAGKRYKG